MTHVFISHASEDKPLIRSIVEFLALKGVRIWVDRPGRGDSHLNLDNDFIDRYAITGLRNGLPWDDQIAQALHKAGVVLACLSRRIGRHREIIENEIVYASIARKLVACTIDDLPFGKIADFGLAQLQSVQADRVDCEGLAQALRMHREELPRDRWPPAAVQAWQRLELLQADIDLLLAEAGQWSPSPARVKTAVETLVRIPVGPPVPVHAIGYDLVQLLAEIFQDSASATLHIKRAMEILWSANPEGFTVDQLLLRPSGLPKLDTVGAESFWLDALLLANHKSRRTLAALLLAPARNFGVGTPVMERPALRAFIVGQLQEPGWPLDHS
jgi:hypothetical protein